jgi:hypothetical protein
MTKGSWLGQNKARGPPPPFATYNFKVGIFKKLSSKANELQTHLLLEPIYPFMP